MNSARENHNVAMEFADLGIRNRARGNQERALAYFHQALDFELAAIEALDQSEGLAWSVLHRSAGTLALDCRDFRQAEQITTRALSGEPHPDIAEELRDLLEQIYFQRHLDLKGVVLQDDELQLSLSGQEVGSGIVQYNEIYGRVDNTSKLLYRTAERKFGRDFREGGQPAKDIRESYQTLVSVPRAGSFAVTLKFGSQIEPTLPGMFDTAAVMDEFMDLLSLVNRSHIDQIQDHISDPAYLRNFFGLAKKLAPDGERVRQVGFTAIRSGVERSVELTTPAAELASLPVPAQTESLGEPITIQGILRYADATRGAGNQIRIIDNSNRKTHRVNVPTGMMNDIVRPMWDSVVTVTGWQAGNVIELEDIWQNEEEVG